MFGMQTEDSYGDNGAGRGVVVTLGLVIVALLGTSVVGGVQLREQHQKLSDFNSAVADLRSAQAAQGQSAAAMTVQVKAAQMQVSGLQTQLSKTQNQLTIDEQQLKLTTEQLPPDLAKLAAQVSPSVVLISCGSGAGSGFVMALTPDTGYVSVVVTAEHVVHDCLDGGSDPAPPGTLTVTSGGRNIPVHLRSADSQNDVALLDATVELPALKPAGEPKQGEFVMAVGNALGVTNNVTQGNISQVYPGSFLNTAPISNGNSGGPVVDRSGQVLGIADAAAVPNADTPVVQNLNVAVSLTGLCAQLLTGAICTTLH
jgi:S1-C subfamily serine protease